MTSGISLQLLCMIVFIRTGLSESPYSCDFESGTTCHWTVASSRLVWSVAQGTGTTNAKRPRMDHTKQNSTGFYMHMQTSNSPLAPYAYITSPEITAESPVCFTFWYQMFGKHVDRLEILLEQPGKVPEIIWSHRGTQGKVWIYEQITVINAQSSKIGIKGWAGDGYDGYIAIDDIDILLETCPPRKMCSFDSDDFCGFDQGNKDFNWTLTERPIPERIVFPLDHTTQTKEGGRYAYLNTTGRETNQVAKLISSEYPLVNGACIKFWFYTSSNNSELRVHLTNGKPGNLVEYFEGRLTNVWNSASISILPESQWQVTFEGVVSDSTEVAIALDDIEISLNDSCAIADFCDFEKDDCLWHNEATGNEINDEADWLRTAAYESSDSMIGPKVDHTSYLPTGYFLRAESSFMTAQGDEVVLVSNILAEDYKCFSFWYHTDEETGILEARYYNSSEHQEGYLLTSITLNTTKRWLPVVTPLPTSNYGPKANFLIKIVAKFGPGKNVIAIDDVRIEKTACSDTLSNTFQCKSSNQTILQSQVCNYVVDCISDGSDEIDCGTCDFESGSCGYRDTSGLSSIEWNVTVVADANKKAPHAPLDHTFANKSGHYAWTEVLRDFQGISVASMYSPMIQYASSTCHLTFWVYKTAPESSSRDLQLFVHTFHGHVEYKIFDLNNILSSTWTKIIVYVGRISQPFNIRFYAELFTGQSFLVVDDIKFTQCDMQMSKTCSENMYVCASQKGCIDSNRVCDFTEDCDDGSDELDCQVSHLGCDFEMSNCYWNNSDNSAQWSRVPGSISSPQRDHTLGTPAGWLLKASYHWDSKAGQKLGGLVFLPSQNCTMRFYYFLALKSISKDTELRILTRQYIKGEEKVYLTRDRNAGDYFFREEVTFNETKSFEVIFDAIIGDPSDTIGLDDVSFDSNCHMDNNSLPVDSPDDPDYCPWDKFECKSSNDNSTSTCITLFQVCNFKYDCPDKTDELECGACSFENGRCGWEDSSSGMYRWERRQAKDFVSDKHNFPIRDHNTNTTNGWFLLLTKNSAGDSFATSSYLESPAFWGTGPTCTLSFWYHVESSAGSLKLLLQSRGENLRKPIASLPDTGENVWNQFTVILGELSASFQLVFEAVVSEENEGANALPIAIDDVTFAKCTLNDSLSDATFHNLSCDFEKGLCDWHQELMNDVVDWKRTNITTRALGPTSDHTTGNGYYLIIEYSEANPYNNIATLLSPVMPETDGFCLHFWYHMFGPHVNFLHVEIASVEGRNTRRIWTQTGSQGNLWHYAMANVVSNVPYQIIIEGSGGRQKSDISLDDVFLSSGQCYQPSSVNCTFELGTCGWTNKTPNSTWVVTAADEVPYVELHDHTTGDPEGHVLFASLLSTSNSTDAELQSGVYPSGSNGSCFHYWFFMVSDVHDNYSLTATVTLLSNDRAVHLVNKAIQLGRGWQYSQVNIPENQNFQVSIIASYYEGFKPTIIVDDFSLSNSRCLEYGSCDFEYDWCGWTQRAVSSDVIWLRNIGGFKSESIGPEDDHTEGSWSGYYAFVDASTGNVGAKAFLISPPLRSGPVVCFSFYRLLLGKDVGTLNIYVTRPSNQREEIFSLEDKDENGWQRAFLNVSNLTRDSVLDIEVTLGGGITGNISIDGLLVEPGLCNTTKMVPTSTVPSGITTLSHTTSTAGEPDISKKTDVVATTLLPSTTRLTSTKGEHNDVTNKTEMSVTTSPPQNTTSLRTSTGDNDWVPIAALPFVMLLAGIAFLAYKRCFIKRSKNDLPIIIENPTYDFAADENILHLGEFPDEANEQSAGQQDSSPPDERIDEGIVNPLYEQF